ncbi:MAG: bifunctional nuclease family protein [Muribaculaceae bacterium]|nr:bifunctional nuclease family protein [Muribaculaceae bacterium]
MGEKIRLELIGITYNQIESGVYALVLKEVGGKRRIPIIIGFPEAQAIECRLQKIATPRPLTHDMTVSMLDAFGIRVTEIFIYQLPNGVFAADILMSDGVRESNIDARSSDAIAIAIRSDAPIYTSEEVLRNAGFVPREENRSAGEEISESETSKGKAVTELTHMTDAELYAAMDRAAGDENYEEAGRIKKELDRRKRK